jgi:hypothetical protein
MEDEDLVEIVARVLGSLDPSIACVVLENPSMVCDRPYSFYRKLKGFGNVVICDPTVPTQWLVQRSLGLLTISGTLALEASIHKIPVHVAGYPEYLQAIRSHGTEDIPQFLESCVAGRGPLSTEAVLSYLETYAVERWRCELGWNTFSSLGDRDLASSIMLEMLESTAE